MAENPDLWPLGQKTHLKPKTLYIYPFLLRLKVLRKKWAKWPTMDVSSKCVGTFTLKANKTSKFKPKTAQFFPPLPTQALKINFSSGHLFWPKWADWPLFWPEIQNLGGKCPQNFSISGQLANYWPLDFV